MDKKIDVTLLPVSEYPNSEAALKHCSASPDALVSDITEIALRELFEIKAPQLKDNFSDDAYADFLAESQIVPDQYGNWVWYPWLNRLIKIPPKEDLRLIRTARNQLLVTPAEQTELFEKTILIAGMSVGSNVLEQMVQGGIGGKYLIADMDVLEITNLNRIKSGLPAVVLPKVVVAARKALELDPYLDFMMLDHGVNNEILEAVFQKHAIDIVVDEVDDISAKLTMRKISKQYKKPLLMATDNSDGAIIDIERYDINPEQVYFNHRLPDDILEKMISGQLPREQAGAAIGKYFVGFDVVDNRLIYSLSQVRKTIPSWPQLGTAASMSGILVAYAAKVIALGGTLQSDRYIASFDKAMNIAFTTEEYAQQRQELFAKMQALA